MTQTEIVKGIVLSSLDYKEKDKLVEIFTVEHGKITAVLKGCKSPNAKLKFAFQPFCFAEFSIVRLGKFYQIIDAKLIDSFFDLTKDLNTYYLASLALELTDVSLEFEEQNTPLFLLVLNVLKHICYDKLPAELVLAKFTEDVMTNLGYKINFNVCSNCGMQYLGKVFLNLDSGAFVCSTCKTENCLVVSNQAFALLKILNNTEYSRLGSIKMASNVARDAILILCKNIENRLLKIIHSAKFI